MSAYEEIAATGPKAPCFCGKRGCMSVIGLARVNGPCSGTCADPAHFLPSQVSDV
jgi:hypothetical protein